VATDAFGRSGDVRWRPGRISAWASCAVEPLPNDRVRSRAQHAVYERWATSLCAECFLEYSEKAKLIDKTGYDKDGEPYMED